jgi:hypothetical protein
MARTATVEIKAFTGIDQSAGGHNVSMNLAYNAYNCDTGFGVLAPSKGYLPVYPSLPAKIVTLGSFYRRNHEIESERRVLVAATQTTLYAILEGGSSWVQLMNGFSSGEWSWVTYETTRDAGTPSDTSDDYMTDIMILSNSEDGVVVVYGDSLTAERKTDLPKFAKLERHAERIWGIGVPGEPDNVYYSQPYNPLNWDLVFDPVDGTTVLPEQSGGVIQMPTWDGDRFIAIKRFSSSLLAFKERSAFYIRGLTTGEFAMIEAYGSDGVLAGDTIITDGPYAYYLSDNGLGIYDGDTARMLDNDRLYGVFAKVGAIAPETACTAISRHVLYLTLPVYTGETYSETIGGVTVTKLVEPTRNNCLIEYNIPRRTYMVRKGIQADAIHNHGGRILFTSGTNPYQVYEITGATFDGDPIPVRWESAWQDLGMKNAYKNAFVVHMTGLQSDAPQQITIGLETERKVKTKTIALAPGYKKTRFPISNNGRRFRFFLAANSETNWSLSGGVQIDMEIDEG